MDSQENKEQKRSTCQMTPLVILLIILMNNINELIVNSFQLFKHMITTPVQL